MAGQLHRNVALAVLGGFKRETASRQRILDLHSHSATVSTVPDPPQVAEIRLFEVSTGRDLGLVTGVNIGGTQSQLDCLRGGAKRREGNLAAPTGELFQLLRVVGAVVSSSNFQQIYVAYITFFSCQIAVLSF